MTARACFQTFVALFFVVGAIVWFVWYFSRDKPRSATGRQVFEVVAKGNRTLGIKVNQGADGDFPKSFGEALVLGNETQVLPQDWMDIETKPGVFNPSPNVFAVANQYYAIYGMPIHLSLRPVHTNRKMVPSDLAERALDDPETIRRFQNLLQWVAGQLPQVPVESLVIGSEVDIYCWGDEQRWGEWTHFYAAVAAYARTQFPKTFITCETTFASFGGRDLHFLRDLHRHSDVVGVSYYPMKPGLRGVRPPDAVHRDFEILAQAIPEKPVMVYQIGYPSSATLGSSQQKQASFITEMFRAWDRYPDRIQLLNLQWMHEAPEFGVDRFTDYYQNNDLHFRAFLGSLGLKGWQGEPKAAWITLERESKARGFGHDYSKASQFR